MSKIIPLFCTLFLFGCASARIDNDSAHKRIAHDKEIKRNQRNSFEKHRIDSTSFLFFWKRWEF